MDFKPPKYEKVPRPEPKPRLEVLSARIVGDGPYAGLVIRWQWTSGHREPVTEIIDLEVSNA